LENRANRRRKPVIKEKEILRAGDYVKLIVIRYWLIGKKPPSNKTVATSVFG
jgi:hypothetical protein